MRATLIPIATPIPPSRAATTIRSEILSTNGVLLCAPNAMMPLQRFSIVNSLPGRMISLSIFSNACWITGLWPSSVVVSPAMSNSRPPPSSTAPPRSRK